eukprot:3899147-Amphidinium_carterae.1
MLGQVVLRPGHDLSISASDLSDCYHTFKVPESHCKHNHIRGLFRPWQLRHLNAFRPELEKAEFLVGCFRALPMGKGYAVEMTQHTHRRILQKVGLMYSAERIQYRSPIPRGPRYQMLVIDDFGALSQDPRGCSCPQSVPMLNSALAQYEKVHLHVSEDKTVKGVKQATVLGAHVDGVRGEVRPIPIRVKAIAEITLQFLSLRVISRAILEELVGIWSSFLLHRRQFFSLLSAVYCEGSQFERESMFRMSASCCEELLSLVLLCPLIFSDIRAQFESKVYTSDASPWGAGLTEAALDSVVVQELGMPHAVD